jgi:hypothetical protein
VERKGQYSKGRRRITEPVIEVPPGLPTAPKIAPEVQAELEFVAEVKAEQTARHLVQEMDKDRLVVRKTTGWLGAGLIVTILISAAYLASTVLTREHQLRHVQDQIKETSLDLEEVRARNRKLERRMVELETAVELMGKSEEEIDED